MNPRRVVITGLGTLTPVGNNVPDFWHSLVTGVSGAGPITHFNAERFKCRIAAEVKNFRTEDFFDRKEGRKLDLFAQYGLVAADEAIRDAGWDLDSLDKSRIGVIWGTGMGGVTTFQDESCSYAETGRVPRFSPFFVTKVISDICPGVISIKYGLRGPNYATAAACASSGIALNDALMLIRCGKADAIVAGGSEAAIAECSIGGFGSMQALSTRNDDPLHASRPFDKDRDGLIPSGGAAALVLEDYEHAKARGANILCEVCGYGFSSNGGAIPQPNEEGSALAMERAMKDACVTPGDIDYVNAHATSTPQGDMYEAKALAKLFEKEHALISSTKSMTGHECWMAGASEVVYSIIMMQNNFVAPNINFENPDEHSEKLNITSKTVDTPLKYVLSNSFGFGGTNSALIIKNINL